MGKIIRKIYEKMPDVVTVTVPPELRNRRVELLILPLSDEQSLDDSSDVADPEILEFFGSMPDFPERDSQGIYEEREEMQ